MRRLTRSELRTFDDTWRHLPQAILPNPKTVSRPSWLGLLLWLVLRSDEPADRPSQARFRKACGYCQGAISSLTRHTAAGQAPAFPTAAMFSFRGSHRRGRNTRSCSRSTRSTWTRCLSPTTTVRTTPFLASVNSHVVVTVQLTPEPSWPDARFRAESGYTPPVTSQNWLKHWEGAATPPPGWGAKPVTWVSREDAAAYCSYYNKRLP